MGGGSIEDMFPKAAARRYVIRGYSLDCTKYACVQLPCASSAIILEKPAEMSSWSAMSGGMAPKPLNGPAADVGAAEECGLLLFGFGRGSKARPFPLHALADCVGWAELQPSRPSYACHTRHFAKGY